MAAQFVSKLPVIRREPMDCNLCMKKTTSNTEQETPTCHCIEQGYPEIDCKWHGKEAQSAPAAAAGGQEERLFGENVREAVDALSGKTPNPRSVPHEETGLASACELVLLFYQCGWWDDVKRAEWDKRMNLLLGPPESRDSKLVGAHGDGTWDGATPTNEATTKNLCNAVRAALVSWEGREQGSGMHGRQTGAEELSKESASGLATTSQGEGLERVLDSLKWLSKPRGIGYFRDIYRSDDTRIIHDVDSFTSKEIITAHNADLARIAALTSSVEPQPTVSGEKEKEAASSGEQRSSEGAGE